jgi:hypothetical protein
MVDEEIAKYLNDQNVGTYNKSGANLFVGTMKPPSTHIPVKSAWILPSGGPAPEHVFGHAYNIRQPTVQILVRGGAYKESRDFAQSIYNALNGASPTGLWPILPMQSEPVWVGPDENNNFIWSINLLVRYKQTAT